MFKFGDKVKQTDEEYPYLTINGAVGVVVGSAAGANDMYIRVWFGNQGWGTWLFLERELTHV